MLEQMLPLSEWNLKYMDITLINDNTTNNPAQEYGNVRQNYSIRNIKL